MKKGVAYCRVSTKGQTGEDKFGIESQKEMIKEYCEKNDIEITDWFIDEGVSGCEKHRPELGRLLGGEITNPPVECVIAAKADRLARDIELYWAFKFMLREMGLEFISVTEDWSATDQLYGKILEMFLSAVAEIEKENIRSRMSGGRKEKAKAGGYAGGKAPMGYKVENGKLVINEEEAEVVRFILGCKNAGMKMRETLRAVNEKGYKTRTGKDFAISTVQSIWNNERTYRGEYHYGGGEWVPGAHEPLI